MPAGLPLYWVVFNILGILQQLYVNRSDHKAVPDTGTGIEVNRKEEVPMKKESLAEKAAGRDKGGRKDNGSPGTSSNKKRKKR